jgi:putative ABC transport system ATP-binding protein
MASAQVTTATAPPSVPVAARALTRRYGEGSTAVDALRGVDLDVRAGELVAVMGPSGSGKSTLMHLLAGLDKPTAGTVTIAGTELSALGDAALTRLRREHIGFIFQFFNLLPMLDAEENVVLPLSIAGEKPEAAWVAELMSKVGLQARRSHRPSELSGGEQQRVALARALINQPAIVLADEPTGNLDSKNSEIVLKMLRHSNQELGQTVLMITHNPEAAAYGDRVIHMRDGEIVDAEKDPQWHTGH